MLKSGQIKLVAENYRVLQRTAYVNYIFNNLNKTVHIGNDVVSHLIEV